MAHERLFDYPFDFQEYIEKRLQEFDDIEERKFAKAVLQDGLLNIIKETEKKYDALEQRVQDEVENDAEKFMIRTTLIKREAYDPVNHTWYPVLPCAANAYLVTQEELWDAVKAKEAIDLFHVFIGASDADCLALLQDSPSLNGKILTDKGEIAAVFTLQTSKQYRQVTAQLYDLFLANQMRWQTVNTAYLDKFFAVRLEKIEGELPQDSILEGFTIDYGSYADMVSADKIPLWNIEPISYRCNPFPYPCLDGINYEHEFSLQALGAEDGYLIEPQVNITDIRHESDRIIIITPQEAFADWTAYRFITDYPARSIGYDAPVLSNKITQSFIGNYLQSGGVYLKTRAELFRRIDALDLGKFLRFEDYEILEVKTPDDDLDDMNWFIGDELFDRRSRRILRLKFKALQEGHYLNDAMVRYATSAIQFLESEFRCIGILEKADVPGEEKC